MKFDVGVCGTDMGQVWGVLWRRIGRQIDFNLREGGGHMDARLISIFFEGATQTHV